MYRPCFRGAIPHTPSLHNPAFTNSVFGDGDFTNRAGDGGATKPTRDRGEIKAITEPPPTYYERAPDARGGKAARFHNPPLRAVF